MTFEERIKAALGDLQFSLLAQVQQADDLRESLAKAVAQIPKPIAQGAAVPDGLPPETTVDP